MISAIGIMISSYIFTRMIQIMTAKDAGGFLMFCAIITMLVAILGGVAVIGSDLQLTNTLAR
jgi:hypothetical protein